MSKEHASAGRPGVARFSFVFDRFHRIPSRNLVAQKSKEPRASRPEALSSRGRSILTLAVGETASVDENGVHRIPRSDGEPRLLLVHLRVKEPNPLPPSLSKEGGTEKF